MLLPINDLDVRAFFFLSRDLLSAFGSSMLPLLDIEPVNEMLTQGRRSKANKTKTLSQWATKEIRKLKNAIMW